MRDHDRFFREHHGKHNKVYDNNNALQIGIFDVGKQAKNGGSNAQKR